MEKIQQIKEKLENIRQDINEAELQDIFTHRGHGWLSAFRININQALALIDEMEKEDEFTIKVKIPEPHSYPSSVDDSTLRFCPTSCAFKPINERCTRGWNKSGTDRIGPGCPRYKGEPK